MSTELLQRPPDHAALDLAVDFEQEARDRIVLNDPVAFAEDYLATAKLQNRTDVTEETIEAALHNADVLLPTARIAIRMPLDGFNKMISSDGVYKTVYETGTTKGLEAAPLKTVETYVNMRRQSEEQLGIKARPGEPETVYGFLDNLESMDMVTPGLQYGTVALVLNPAVTNRATFTKGDTMRGPTTSMDLPTATVAKAINDIAEVSGNHKVSYVEAQVFGGVSMDDVEKVSLTLDDSQASHAHEQIEAFISGAREDHPDLPITIRLPAGRSVLTSSVNMAAKYPDVQFVYYIDVRDVAENKGGSIDTPYSTMMSARHLSSTSGATENFKYKMVSEAEKTHHISQERLKLVREKLTERWSETTGQEKLPSNVQVLFTRSKFSR
ncbi:DUF3626 domain-containing protein [Candidatus Saccharibacteria bacterium]|nr:DUF3626 domain-containing protein [Candidatus Saccharibacteria bacterium]